MITPHGRNVARLPIHPRLAHMVLRGMAEGHALMSVQMAAMLEDRDILR
jgi:ATP-dependent helicase HrpB